MDIKLFDTEEEVNAYLGITPTAEPDLSWIQPQHRKAVIAVAKLFNIHEAHNKANNFVADWNDSSQIKYSVWEWVKASKKIPAGFGFSLTASVHWITDTTVGSRLCVGTSEEVFHIAEKFEQLYLDWFIISPETPTNEEN